MLKFIFFSCLLTAASAQAISPVSKSPFTHLAPVEQTKDGHAVLKKATPVAPAIRKAPVETFHRLDSVVGYNSDGSKGTLQVFGYDDNNWWVETQKYVWSQDGWGEPVETFFCTRMDNGFILSEVNMAYGYGVRNDYDYDERGRGIMMTSYSFDGNDWIPTGMGEYDYDDNDNIIEEYTHYWDATSQDWIPSAHNIATWDDKHRQTSIEQYYWDGKEWQPITKVDYAWFNGPYDPDYIEGTEKERMSYRGEYISIDGKWLLAYISENYFNNEGRVSGQSWKYYNREYDNWYGGDDLDGRLFLCNSWVSEMGYDERGIMNKNRTFQYVPGPEEKLFELGHVEYFETPKENGDFEILAINQNNIFDESGNIVGTKVIDKVWYGYNANGKKLAVYEEMPFGGEGPMVPMLEDKWGYDEYGYLSETMSFDFDADYNRVPSNWVIEKHDADGNTMEIIGYANGNSGGLTPLTTRGDGNDSVVEREYCITDNDREDNWVPTNRWVNTYENGVQTQHIGYTWGDDYWMNSQGQNNFFDFSVAVENMLVPQLYTDIYKIDRIEYLQGYGDEWITTNAYYYYSEYNPTSIKNIDTDKLVSFDGEIVRILDGTDSAFTVYDLTGKTVLSTFGPEADISSLPKGIYMVTMESRSGRRDSMKVWLR